jgi:SPP1 family holin
MKVKVSGIVSLILAVLALLNFILTAIGVSPIPVDASAVNAFVTTIFQIAGIIGIAWSNFNVTTAAQKGQALTDAIKDGAIDYNEADRLIRDVVKAGKLK